MPPLTVAPRDQSQPHLLHISAPLPPDKAPTPTAQRGSQRGDIRQRKRRGEDRALGHRGWNVPPTLSPQPSSGRS